MLEAHLTGCCACQLGITTWSVPHESLFPEVPAHPSCILPHVTIGSEADALNPALYGSHGFTHVLNVSVDCPAPAHVPSDKFMRIPILDNHTASLLPYLDEAFKFIDNAKTNQGHVLVHCAAGISRSPAVVIAYLMHSSHMQMRDAYEFVRSKRSSIAPNFNFLGQLLELNGRLFPSASPGHSVTGSGESTPTQQPSLSEPRHIIPSRSSGKPPVRIPSPIPSASPKHTATKKRERPNHLSLDVHATSASEFVRPAGGTYSYQSSPMSGHMAGSPSEGKRSRVSLLNPPLPWTSGDQFLPSPCTGMSNLQLSSPSDPQRTLTQTLLLQSSMDKLYYEPCFVGGGESTPATLSASSGGLRRSLTSLGMSSASPGPIRPTLLAERHISPEESRIPEFSTRTAARVGIPRIQMRASTQIIAHGLISTHTMYPDLER
ncbi:unnamed protein product [Echinostoma caproni]|uniref:protein-tyrosine-phosphatase n=1 Tax=Echinostoma caproni TaxID=27848 RepID=A0A183AMX7_9TREM|nr:unnamed protein product [Echinostoma caproni]